MYDQQNTDFQIANIYYSLVTEMRKEIAALKEELSKEIAKEIDAKTQEKLDK